MTHPSPVDTTAHGPLLRRTLRPWDVVLFLVAAVVGPRWIATAAAAGPPALVVWLMAFVAFFVPLAFTVVELSSRYPEEGGIYAWSKRAFGEFAGFMTGWLYWTSNLVYFPGLLYFAAANALFIGGRKWEALSNLPVYFIAASLVGLAIALGLNLVGLDVGKWLHNVGGIATWLPIFLLILMGAAAFAMFGSATSFSAAAFLPSIALKDVVFWSTIAFAFGGLEAASFMGEEIVDAPRTIPRAILGSGAIITSIYVLGTLAVLLALPKEEVSGLQGIMQAISRTAERVGLPGVAPVSALLITLGSIGGVGAWLASTARLPFVAGIDRYLPAAFARLHPRWGTPHVALLVQAVGAALIVVLGQAGTTVAGAYEVLVSMGVISFFIPYVFMFAAMIKLQKEPAGPGVIRVPGGPPVAIFLSALGLATTVLSIGLAVVPAADEANKTLAVVKILGATFLLIALGLGLYAWGRVRRRASS